MEPVKMPEDIHLTVILSTEPKSRNLVTMFDEIAAIRAIKVHRDKLNTIPEKWKTGCGFYILVSDISNGRFQAYVGKATQDNLADRVASHRREKENWTYAFLFQRDTSNGLTSTQASYVEGAVYRKLKECPWISVINNQIAGDKTLAVHELFYMHQVVKSAFRILNIFGYSMEEGPTEEIVIADKSIEEIVHIEEDVKSTEGETILNGQEEEFNSESTTLLGLSGKKYYGVSISQLVESGFLYEGEKLVFLSTKAPAKAVLGKQGIIFDGEESAPSKSATAIMRTYNPNRQSCNGWNYWTVERDGRWVTLEHCRNQYIASKKLTHDS